MTEITVHAHPDGVLLKIPEDMPVGKFDHVRVGAQIADALGERFQASLVSKSFVEIVKLHLEACSKPASPELHFLYGELSDRLERLTAHERIRLGAMK